MPNKKCNRPAILADIVKEVDDQRHSIVTDESTVATEILKIHKHTNQTDNLFCF